MKKETKFANIRTQLLGQAGVWAVASQLAIRGHIPIFPGVDYGWDLMLENGLKIQVKAASLMQNFGNLRNRYPGGVYHFNFRNSRLNYPGKRIDCVPRDYSKVADFFVLWGIDENRFWIMPTKQHKNSFFMCSRSPLNEFPQYVDIKRRNEDWENNWDSLNMNLTVETLIESAGKTVEDQEKI